MPRLAFPRSLRWSFVVAAAGWSLAAGALSGCPGSLDPSIMEPPQTGSGGTTGGGSGGSTGSGGSNTACSGNNDGAMIVTNNCALACHSPGNPLNAGLDLTIDSNVGSRLVGVKSSGSGMSACGNNSEAYLVSGSNPASGLLIDKIQQSQPPCGVQMPYLANPLSSTQQQCLIQWATTLTHP